MNVGDKVRITRVEGTGWEKYVGLTGVVRQSSADFKDKFNDVVLDNPTENFDDLLLLDEELEVIG